MAKYIVFDPSHISRIRYGKSKPSNPIEFTNKICSYILFKYKSPDDLNSLIEIIGCDKDITNEKIYDVLFTFLTSEKKILKNQISDFLHNLDTFNLDDYIKVIKFDKLKVPNIPFYKGKTKHYYGIEEMKEGELNFFKSTVLSKSKEDIFMCSDMPMEDMAKDTDFGKKWMFAIAMCLKKGHHLNIIHNLDRPFNEMMLGLESWIPIYMTGQISPYYLNNVKNNVYNHLNYVSGVTALTGECIKGYHNKGMYYLSTNKNEVKYYKEKCDLLLKKAKPLMEIYRENNQNEYELFLKNDENINGNRKRFLSSLPIFTITDELLKKILKRNKVSKLDIEKIIKYKNSELKYMNNILKNNSVNDYIYIIKENENIKNLEARKANYVIDKKHVNNNKAVNYIQESMQVSQGKLVISLNIDSNIPNLAYIASIYNAILGGGANSRLFQNVREKESLAYTAGSNYLKQKNVIFIRCGIEIENYEKALETIKVQIENLKKGEITEEDIENAKKLIIASVKSITSEQDTEITYYYGQELSGTFTTITDYENKVNSVTKEQIVEIANSVSINTIYFLKD